MYRALEAEGLEAADCNKAGSIFSEAADCRKAGNTLRMNFKMRR